MRRCATSFARRGVAALTQAEAVAAPRNVQHCSPHVWQPPPLDAAQCQQQRGLQLLQLFNKESRAKRRQRLKEDLQRGYFDDFKELKDTGGKLWRAPDRLIPEDAAQPFPDMRVVRPDKVVADFPHPPDRAPAATLVCLGFKDGSEDMLATWSDPFVERFHDTDSASLAELSVVESRVMSMWPFRNMILRAPRRAAAAAAAAVRDASAVGPSPTEAAVAEAEAQPEAGAMVSPAAAGDAGGDTPPTAPTASSAAAAPAARGGAAAAASAASTAGLQGGGGGDFQLPAAGGGRLRRLHLEHLFFFGDAYDICRALQITNRLIGYVFLLDRKGRVRFRGCGRAEAAERDALVQAAERLLEAS